MLVPVLLLRGVRAAVLVPMLMVVVVPGSPAGLPGVIAMRALPLVAVRMIVPVTVVPT